MQSIDELGVEELQLGLIGKDMNPKEKEALEKVMFQPAIEASLRGLEIQDIVEIDPGAKRLYPKHVFEDNEREVNVTLS
ncbi:hypothetical protein GYH30_052166 [Glycine max]|nr:hypothetical protein GYH30_052166 [Glycine max]